MNAPESPARSAPSEAALLAILGALVLLSIDQGWAAAQRGANGSVALSAVLAILVVRMGYHAAREAGSWRIVILGLIGAALGYGLAQLLIRFIIGAVDLDVGSAT